MMNREQNQYDLNGTTRESNNSRDFVTGAIVGGLAGALAALLLAPKSGKELRGTLNEQTSTLKSKGIDLASVAKEKAGGLKETVSQQSSTLVNKVKDMKNQNGMASQVEEGELQEVPTSMAETSSMENTHTATGEEIQKKLEETQKAFDETETKLNQ
ncbi:YtxH domain-containing protein [Mesobacillus subterraneus]|jgi:gas vesicle protein|uniref:YtxH domain-containing protein n=1 Tax=Mesobacillus subterraneus TaxID=285983 RepID=UPI002041A46A|nr:YtxH domain-containing protein [Mesobacillus subterraneus]MCM3666017.1 YtxH domain-containing protein [Mesobacillus subterraneus]MCM3684900.1 YtxH domain-containing protein [Mesobacillus subterraneus]